MIGACPYLEQEAWIFREVRKAIGVVRRRKVGLPLRFVLFPQRLLHEVVQHGRRHRETAQPADRWTITNQQIHQGQQPSHDGAAPSGKRISDTSRR